MPWSSAIIQPVMEDCRGQSQGSHVQLELVQSTESWTFHLPSLRFGVLDAERHRVHGLFCEGPSGFNDTLRQNDWPGNRQSLVKKIQNMSLTFGGRGSYLPFYSYNLGGWTPPVYYVLKKWTPPVHYNLKKREPTQT